eukprot:scaffold297864_cov39-Tisochrysis_lutea.AAC.1
MPPELPTTAQLPNRTWARGSAVGKRVAPLAGARSTFCHEVCLRISVPLGLSVRLVRPREARLTPRLTRIAEPSSRITLLLCVILAKVAGIGELSGWLPSAQRRQGRIAHEWLMPGVQCMGYSFTYNRARCRNSRRRPNQSSSRPQAPQPPQPSPSPFSLPSTPLSQNLAGVRYEPGPSARERATVANNWQVAARGIFNFLQLFRSSKLRGIFNFLQEYS